MSDRDFRPRVESVTDWAIKDETAKGWTCPVCGALLPPTGAPVKRHREWHEALEDRLGARPGSMGGDNGGG